MKYLILTTFFIPILLLLSSCKRDEPLKPVYTDWKIYNSSNSGLPGNGGSVAFDSEGNKWIAVANTNLVKFDDNTWTVYNLANLGIFDIKYIGIIKIDANDNKWMNIFYPSRIVKFDGVNWTHYNEIVAGVSDPGFRGLTVEDDGTVWVATGVAGIAKFDGTRWINYNTSNSGLPSNYTWDVAIDKYGNKWIATSVSDPPYPRGGVLVFNDTTWTEIYHPITDKSIATHWIKIDMNNNKWMEDNINGGLMKLNDGNYWTLFDASDHPSLARMSAKFAFESDKEGNIWIGTRDGLLKFDGGIWTLYDTTNSGLPDNEIGGIAINNEGEKWISTKKGLAVFK